MFEGILLIGGVCCVVLGLAAYIRSYRQQSEIDEISQKLQLLSEQLRSLREGRSETAKSVEPALVVEYPKQEEKPQACSASETPETKIAPQSPPPRPELGNVASGSSCKALASPVSLKTLVQSGVGAYEKKPAPALPSMNWEEVIGKRWLTWAGVAILFFCAAFFLKYAFENRLIGPSGQVGLCALAGAAILCGGSRLQAKGMAALGQGLTGLGLAVLYVTFGAASSAIYDPPVLTQAPAFLLLVLVTVVGMVLAILHEAPAIAILAVLGGLATPLLVSTGHNSRDALFAYLLLLNLGVFGVAFFRKWRALDALAIIGTYILYSGWFAKYYSEEQLLPALFWLGAFYLLFLCLPFIYHLLHRTALTLERFILALANAVLCFGFCWHMLQGYEPRTIGFVALTMAAFYLGMGVLCRRRLPQDSTTLFGAVALATAFLTLAIPLHLHAHGITLAWAIEGPVLLYLGYRFACKPARLFAWLVMVISVIRLFAAHWPLHSSLYEPFFNKTFLSAAFVPAAMGVFAYIHYRFKNISEGQDRVMQLSAALIGGFIGLLLVQVECCGWVADLHGRYAERCVASAIWTAGALAYLISARWVRSAALWLFGCLALLVAFVYELYCLDMGWQSGSLLMLNSGFFAGVFLVVAVFAYAKALGSERYGEPNASFAGLFWGAGMLLLFSLLSWEVPAYVEHGLCWSGQAARMSLTMAWGVYAACLLSLGFIRNNKALRYCSLGLFALAAAKLLFMDMREVGDLLRIASFLVVGLLLLAASYLYHLMEKRLSAIPTTQSDESEKI